MRAIVRRRILLALVAVAAASLVGWPPIASRAQEPATKPPDLRAGANFIPTKVSSPQEDQKVLKLFAGLRVSDVVDGMDKAGLQGVGQVSADVRPVWRDTVHYSHRFVGIAVTARYVPTNKPPAGHRSTEEFDRWVGQWYKDLSSEPFVALIRPGTAVVIEDAASVDVGTIGSNNILGWKAKGCVGVVTSAGARDTDEISTERIPLYFAKPGRGIRPGRNEIESVNRPIVVGGVLVRPGDVIVADGDGVIVGPREHAEEVAEYARTTLEGDKAGRRKLYQKLNVPPDDSVK
jgi:4-hydroxy-4-methyl-2-oxoglutarate aldolase